MSKSNCMIFGKVVGSGVWCGYLNFGGNHSFSTWVMDDRSIAKSYFFSNIAISNCFGYILHPILVLEAVQARTLISNGNNALQQVLQNAFCGTHFFERLSYRSTVADVQGTPFRSKKDWNNCTLSMVEPLPMSCVLCRKNSQWLLSHLHCRPASLYSRGRALSSSVLVIRPKPSLYDAIELLAYSIAICSTTTGGHLHKPDPLKSRCESQSIIQFAVCKDGHSSHCERVLSTNEDF